MNAIVRYFAICYLVGLLGLLGATLDLTERYFKFQNKQITNSRRALYQPHVVTCNH